jgi:methylglyoxal synthase
VKDPLERIREGEQVIALIAHNEMKLRLCEFVVRNAKRILEYDRILCTGTTGLRVTEFLAAGSTHSDAEIERKVVRCNSGPDGGDVQIAAAVIEQKCGTVIFFQDPNSVHSHELDISLFEQALLSGVHVRFAPNPRAAEELLEQLPRRVATRSKASDSRRQREYAPPSADASLGR